METISCDLCESKDQPLVLERETRFLSLGKTPYRVSRCRDCGLTYLNPQPDWEELSKVYSRDYLDSNYYDLSSVNEYRLKSVYPGKITTLRRYQLEGKLLDIGCGLGGFLYLARQAGYDCFGWEPSASLADQARQKYDLNIISDKTLENSYDLESFDIIHMHHVLEHVPHPAETLYHIYQLLKPGGYFHFEVPNDLKNPVFCYKMVKLLAGNTGPFIRPSLQHLYFFDYATILHYLLKFNFKIIFIKGKFHEIRFNSPLARPLLRVLTFSDRYAPSVEILCRKL